MNTKLAIFLFTILFFAASCKETKDDLKTYNKSNPKIVLSTFTDTRDNHTYHTINFEGQTWLIENLAFDTLIGLHKYKRDTYYSETVYVYDWYTAQKVCPKGWHLPSDNEWCKLEGHLDTKFSVDDQEWSNMGYRGSDAGIKLKSLKHYDAQPAYSGNDKYQLSGYSDFKGVLNGTQKEECYWTSTKFDSTFVWFHGVNKAYDGIYRAYCQKDFGFAVRCIKN